MPSPESVAQHHDRALRAPASRHPVVAGLQNTRCPPHTPSQGRTPPPPENPRFFPPHPQPKTQILPQRFDPTDGVHLASLFLQEQAISEEARGSMPSLFRRHTSRHELPPSH